MSDDKHVMELIPAYALDCLDDDETKLVAAHLEECPACRAELDTYRQVVDDLAFAAPDATPPANLQARLMGSIQPALAVSAPTRPWLWQSLVSIFGRPIPAWSLVGALVLLVAVWIWLTNTPTPAVPPQSSMQTVALLGTEAAPEAQGLLVIGSTGNEGALVVEDLPPLEINQQYQLWLIDAEGQRTSGAIFSVDAEGYAATMVSSPLPLTDYSAFGITIEPAGGSPGPTGQKVLGGTF